MTDPYEISIPQTTQKARGRPCTAKNTMNFQPARLLSYDKDSVLREIRRVVNGYFNRRCPTTRQFVKHSRVSASVVTQHFGSWAAAMRMAGFDYNRSPIQMQELLNDLQRIFKLAGNKYFTQQVYSDMGGKFSVKTLKSRLGYRSWRDLLERHLGAKPAKRVIVRQVKRHVANKAELLAELLRVWRVLGRRPKYTEFPKYSKYGTKPYENRFGSWKTAIFEVLREDVRGQTLKGTSGTHADKSMLLMDLKAVVSRTQPRVLSYNIYRRLGGTYPQSSFKTNFGSWTAAIAALKLDIKPGRRPNPKLGLRTCSDEDYFAELQRLWEYFGRQPTSKEMSRMGKISRVSFQQRFGSWNKAIHAFCKDRESDRPAHADLIPPEEHEPVEPMAELLTNPAAVQGQLMAPSSPGTLDSDASVIEMTTPRRPSLSLQSKVMSRDRFKCCKCGRSPATDKKVSLEVDHKLPYSQGGQTIFENLQTLCKDCNRRKSDGPDL